MTKREEPGHFERWSRIIKKMPLHKEPRRTQADRDDDLAIGRELERKDAKIDKLTTALRRLDVMITDWARDEGFPPEQSACWQVVPAGARRL